MPSTAKSIPLTVLAHQLIATHIRPGDHCIDATTGNGKDTVFLARAVGETGHVYGFDIQAPAIEITRQTLAKEGLGRRVTLFCANHATAPEAIPTAAWPQIRCAVFNLGYLPGGDHSITTDAHTSVKALESIRQRMPPGAFISVLCYPGHPEGAIETAAVETWASQLPANTSVTWHQGTPGRTGTTEGPRLLSLVLMDAPAQPNGEQDRAF